jgi:G3E family GTPase
MGLFDTDKSASRLPVSLITGFLGSGKTTLLNKLLRHDGMGDSAVIINEFGEVGLDHLLVQAIDGEVAVLASGCVCCTLRSDLEQTLRDLLVKRDRGEVPAFSRILVETTGLADPAPIVQLLLNNPLVSHFVRLDAVVTTVDAVNGLMHLDRQEESVKQAAVADRIVITKTDIAADSDVAELRRRLTRLNPAALQLETAPGRALDPDLLLTRDLYDLDGRAEEVRRWIAVESEAMGGAAPHHHHVDVNRHDARIHAFCLRFERPLDWTAFGVWLTMLLHRHGSDVLRVKGLLNVPASRGPVVVHGVQHLVHAPDHLPEWPDGDHSSRIVFIVRGLSRDAIERSLAAFARLGAPAAEKV